MLSVENLIFFRFLAGFWVTMADSFEGFSSSRRERRGDGCLGNLRIKKRGHNRSYQRQEMSTPPRVVVEVHRQTRCRQLQQLSKGMQLL
jgi:hypothetical protein